MGNANNSDSVLQKSQGFRIISVQRNSPFEGKVEQFFDFIIEVIPAPQQKSATDILDKLSNDAKQKSIKSPLQIINQSIDKVIQVKIVSTKYRKVRTIQVTPNNKWAGTNDIIGLHLRKQKYDEAFDTYFPITDIKENSPIRKAGAREGQYLIGCHQYSYVSIDAFMEGLYEIFFNKETKDKVVHLALYDFANDQLIIKEIILRRGWGGKGLLGCEFLQGMLHKFPNDFEVQKKIIQQKQAKKRQILQLKNELGQCDGVSKSLVQALKNQKSSKSKKIKNIKNLLNVNLPDLGFIHSVPAIQRQQSGNALNGRQIPQNQSIEDKNKIEQLQRRVAQLQQTLFDVQTYLRKLQEPESQEIKE